jgi:hypothetical protein
LKETFTSTRFNFLLNSLAMKFSVLICAAMCGAVSAVPFVSRQNVATPEQIAALAVDLGGFPNTNPNSGGDCDGPRQPDGRVPKVPCVCPPLRDAYITALTANVKAGFAVNNTGVRVSFPTGNSVQDKKGRITAAVITLQNLKAAGVGCPGVSTTFAQQSKNLDTCGDFQCGGAAPPPAAPAPAPTQAPAPAPPVNVGAGSTTTVTVKTVVTSTVTVTRDGATPTPQAPAQVVATPPPANTGAGVISRDTIAQLAPQLGSVANNNPNRFGDCDGPRQPDGKIPKVPCACPPNREEFVNQLFANVQAGHAIRNPTVKLSFPTGNSKADQHARITAATITLQNLNGPGQGCPNVSTTLKAQSDAIGN